MDDGRDDMGEDGAVRAFAELTREVSLLRAAITGLTAARDAIDIPDYEPTLARTERLLTELTRRIDAMGKSPAMMLTPEEMGQRLNAAVTDVARELRHQIGATDTMLRNVAGSLSDRLGAARRRDEQNRLLLWTGLGGLVLGVLLYAMMAGPIARLAPSGWLWPERMAARIVDERTPWEAGKHLMRRASPASWDAIVSAANLAKDNREMIDKCRAAAAKVKSRTVRCTIKAGN
ncbi:DUF6118 family protein [Sphingomonas sp. BAUL-RG-20F-R05-02]|uniref:DUF6118 family protein n=1 Tax=Sphingomonas sp. BAUL-RG-20F-R05-02 TaxID=2914830 RepID=UPI001F596ACC|nr:DUF6118 family protein [Sphingomonas sp. BAUL-RG-20F-R05-02]